MTATAIFGADGFIGSHLLHDLRRGNQAAVGIARTAAEGLLGLDLARPDISPLGLKSRGVNNAVIVAAVTGIAACERDPANTRAVNVDGTVELGRQLTLEGIRVIAFSSDYVFDGVTGNYDETSPVNPVNEYGRQKSEMESRLQEACGSNVLIIRLGKAFDVSVGSGTLLDEMAGKLLRGEQVPAASDQIFCPTYVGDIVNIIGQLLRKKTSGLLHVCAPSKLSRFALAQLVAQITGYDGRLVREISLSDLGEPFSRPHDTSMLCNRLVETLDYGFRNLHDCIKELKSNYDLAAHGKAY